MGVQGGSITTDIIKNGLVFNMDAANRACYPKTGTTVTDTVSNNSCTLNGTTFSNVNSGIFNFDGTNDFVSIPSVSNLNFGTGDLTYSIWVKASFSSSNRYFIGTFTDPTSNNGGIALGTHTAEYPSWKVWFSGTAFVTGTAAIVDGEWHHFVLTRDSGTVQVYIDGVADGASATITTSITNPVALQVGRLMNGLEYWNGDINPIQIYNRALSSSEVLHNYNALKSRFGL